MFTFLISIIYSVFAKYKDCIILSFEHLVEREEDPLNLKKSSLDRGAVFIFTAGSLWGSIGLFIRLMSDAGSSAAAISFLRMAFAFLILLVITLIRSGISAFRVSKKTLFFSAALGLVCHGIYNVFYSLAVVQIGVTVSAVLLNIAPVFTILFSAMFFHEKITSHKCFALIVNISGCILAATGGQFDTASLSALGLLSGLASGLCYALTAIFGKLAGEKSDPFVVSTYSYFFAALFLVVFMRPWEGSFYLSPSVVWLGFLYALIPTAIAYLFYYQGVQQIHEVSKVPVIASMETVVAALLGILVLKEQLSFFHYLGIVIVIVSIALMQRKTS